MNRDDCEWGILPDVPAAGCSGVVETINRHLDSDMVVRSCLPCAAEITRQNVKWIARNV